MSDTINTEAISQNPSYANSKTEQFKKWLRNFGRKKGDTSEAQVQGNQELQPVKSINELLGVKEAEEFKPAQSILFHTTPTNNLDNLRLHGLFAQKDDPSLGINIGYSTFFATEHYMRQTGQTVPFKQVRVATPEDYDLTIWKKNSATLKTNGSFKDRGFYQPSMVPSPGPALDAYVEAAIAGNKDYAYFGNLAPYIVTHDAMMVPPDYFAGTIHLDKNNRDLITKNMVLAEMGMISADQIEQSLRGILPSDEIAHAVTASLEQNLIRNSVMTQVKLLKGQSMPNPELSTTALIQTMLLRTKVNDRVSALYLDKSITWLLEKLKEAGLDPHKIAEESAKKIQEFNQNPQTIKSPVKILDVSRSTNYYGSLSTFHAAGDIKQDLMIAY